MSTKNSKSKTNTEVALKRKSTANDEIIARIEISDGNCFRQVVEYFKTTVGTIPLTFYTDKMVILRGNADKTVINEASFDNTDFIVDYTVNPEFFNDPNNVKIIKQKVKVIENNIVKYIEETIEVPDPRHIYIPTSDVFYNQVKTITRKDGFCITIYKYQQDDEEIKQKSNIKQWIPDSYMKFVKISANSASDGEIKIESENIKQNEDYMFEFEKPAKPIPNQKVRMNEMCTTCNNFNKLHYDVATFLVHQRGLRMMGKEGKSGQNFGWGVYKDPVVSKKIVIKDPDAEYDSFGVPRFLIKAISKLQTMAGNGGVLAVRSNEFAMELKMPISTVGKLKTLIIPPIEDDDDEDEEKTDEDNDEDS